MKSPISENGTGPGKSGSNGSIWWLFILQVVSIALVFVTPYSDCRDILIMRISDGYRFIELEFYILSFAIMHLVESYPGGQFSVEVTVQENHRLITTGPVRFVRHPRYLGIMIFTLGLAFIFKTWFALALVF